VQVELTEEESKMCFRKKATPDLTAKVLAAIYPKFTLPVKDEGFDEVKYTWQPEAKAKQYLTNWIQERKLTTRVSAVRCIG